ncbi:MAG: hypothetical protein ACLGGV_08020, partial [Bacteroidia bacterium]
MKNQIKKTVTVFGTAALLLSVSVSHAQKWRIDGNNSIFPTIFADRINANSFVGSTSTTVPFNLKTTQAQPVVFFTTNLERMRISPDGLVGINIATPEATLDVNGTIKITALACDNCLVTT